MAGEGQVSWAMASPAHSFIGVSSVFNENRTDTKGF
jgi:hypothetical protein